MQTPNGYVCKSTFVAKVGFGFGEECVIDFHLCNFPSIRGCNNITK